MKKEFKMKNTSLTKIVTILNPKGFAAQGTSIQIIPPRDLSCVWYHLMWLNTWPHLKPSCDFNDFSISGIKKHWLGLMVSDHDIVASIF